MEEHSTQLTLYIPSDLEESVPRSASAFPVLETLVARGDTSHLPYRGDAHLLALFGGESSHATARAAVSYFAHTTAASDGWRIIASPVHLQADHATLHFPSQVQSKLSEEESRSLMMSCQEHFAGEGWQLDYGEADTWYLQVPHSNGITATPLDEAVGKSLFDSLPQGDDARIWRRWINEAQMLFHSHAVNAARRGRGEVQINSLWFWGEGRLPVLNPGRFSHVYGDDRFVEGLAQLSGAQWSARPKALSEIGMNDGSLLIVLDEENQSRWEDDWFVPLPKLLKCKTITQAEFHFSNGFTTRLSSSMLWRLWRRKCHSLSQVKEQNER